MRRCERGSADHRSLSDQPEHRQRRHAVRRLTFTLVPERSPYSLVLVRYTTVDATPSVTQP
jgi:hypothetical protein